MGVMDRSDVLIIGGGIAGIVTALELLDGGKSVILLDRDGEGDRGPRALAEAYVSRCTDDVYKFVRGHGVTFLPVVNWVERGEFVPGNSVPRFHVSWGTGKGLAEALIAALRGHGNAGRLTLRFNARVEQLVMQGGKVVGASGVDEKTGAPFEFFADAIVVAGGGINGSDLSRVRANWHRDWKT